MINKLSSGQGSIGEEEEAEEFVDEETQLKHQMNSQYMNRIKLYIQRPTLRKFCFVLFSIFKH